MYIVLYTLLDLSHDISRMHIQQVINSGSLQLVGLQPQKYKIIESKKYNPNIHGNLTTFSA